VSVLSKKSDAAPPPPPLPKSSKDKKRKLPPNWKMAKNDKGKVYYYHKITKKSQWHFPTEESVSERAKKLKEKNDEKSPSSQIAISSSTAATSHTTNESSNDAASSEFKKQKDVLREELSNLIRKILAPYLKGDCKAGRIQTNEEFKHLARKFTHAILEKEISRAKTPEDLQLSKRVKIKTQDYVIKYMQKYTSDSISTNTKVAK
jgi:histone-lysine N-methyltransferase SETD2